MVFERLRVYPYLFDPSKLLNARFCKHKTSVFGRTLLCFYPSSKKHWKKTSFRKAVRRWSQSWAERWWTPIVLSLDFEQVWPILPSKKILLNPLCFQKGEHRPKSMDFRALLFDPGPKAVSLVFHDLYSKIRSDSFSCLWFMNSC